MLDVNYEYQPWILNYNTFSVLSKIQSNPKSWDEDGGYYLDYFLFVCVHVVCRETWALLALWACQDSLELR